MLRKDDFDLTRRGKRPSGVDIVTVGAVDEEEDNCDVDARLVTDLRDVWLVESGVGGVGLLSTEAVEVVDLVNKARMGIKPQGRTPCPC